MKKRKFDTYVHNEEVVFIALLNLCAASFFSTSVRFIITFSHFEWIIIFLFFFFSIDQNNSQSGSTAPAKAISGAEFKERAAFNRRRGAMRRRVHQVNVQFILFLSLMTIDAIIYCNENRGNFFYYFY